MNQAWDLLFEGKINEAKKLVEADFYWKLAQILVC